MKICNAFIGMRLHSQIYSTMIGLPLIVLDYHQKCSNFAKDINIPKSQIFSLQDINEEHFFNTLLTICHLNINCSVSEETIQQSFIKINKSIKLFLVDKGSI